MAAGETLSFSSLRHLQRQQRMTAQPRGAVWAELPRRYRALPPPPPTAVQVAGKTAWTAACCSCTPPPQSQSAGFGRWRQRTRHSAPSDRTPPAHTRGLSASPPHLPLAASPPSLHSLPRTPRRPDQPVALHYTAAAPHCATTQATSYLTRRLREADCPPRTSTSAHTRRAPSPPTQPPAQAHMVAKQIMEWWRAGVAPPPTAPSCRPNPPPTQQWHHQPNGRALRCREGTRAFAGSALSGSVSTGYPAGGGRRAGGIADPCGRGRAPPG